MPNVFGRASSARRVRGAAHTIRIIGGNWKRTPLAVLDLEGLRPTPDRVRETLFNWLGQRLDGQRCLDLFAGSGALGFEAASRGAARVVMVECNAQAVWQLRANQARLAAHMIEIVHANAFSLASSLAPGTFDTVFLDPPFRSDMLTRAIELSVPLLSADGVLYVESDVAFDRSGIAALSDWSIVRQAQAGAVYYHLLQRGNN